ncbi:MAG: DUF401 family protein [Clostridiales bacterium]|nr:DUF401 family protein [Clostridiales bacterium]
MILLNLCIIFFAIILLIRLKMPLWGAVLSASLLTAVLFHITPTILLERTLHTILGKSCIELLLITYGLILLQNLMDTHSMLARAEEGLMELSSNPRLESIVSPVISGLLPSPAAVLMAGTMLQRRYKNVLSNDTLAFITTYFRHIPEALLPVYTNVILICAVTRTPEWLFLLLMLPYTISNILVPYFIYLKPLHFTCTPNYRAKPKFRSVREIMSNLWPVFLIICSILILHINAAVSVYLTLILFILQNRISLSSLMHFFKKAFNRNMLLMVATILIFTDILNYTGAPSSLLNACENISVPLFLVYGFVVFAGSIVSNFTAMVPAVFPLAVSSGSSSIAMVIYLASLGHLASQLCPTHICISLCADQFHISINDIFRKTIPVTGIMLIISTILYLLMSRLPY